MWSWNQFRNLPKNQGLSPQEQARQYFIHQSNMMMEASNNNAAAAASSAAAGAGAGAGGAGGGGRRKPSGWIYSALESLNSRYEEITDLVPNLYCFWDDYPTTDEGGTPILTGIGDGGDDMYDGANYMNTNLTANWDDIKEGGSDDGGPLAKASIPYTHTQADNDDDDNEYFNPPMDGQVKPGDSYFGAGSKYFTNMYPGLFIMVADDISISEFNISGNVGSDGDGTGAGSVDFIIPGWTLFYKTNTDGSDGTDDDPSINQLILVPGTSTGITQEYDESSEDDDHRISGIDDRSRIIYAVVARQPEEDVLSEVDAVKVAQKILEIFTTPSLTDLLIFGIKSITTSPPDDYMLFNLKDNGTVSAFETTNEVFYGPTVFADNPDDGFKYFLSKSASGSELLFGKMSDSGEVTILHDDLLDKLGGAIDNLVGSVSFTSVTGSNNTYIGITGSTTLGYGYGASFDIIVSGGTVSSVLVNMPGDLYKVNDTISISADKIGGTASQNLIITINSIKSDASPTSLYYEGEGQFIYMDRFLIIDTNDSDLSPKIARIYTNGDVDLVTVDNTVSEYNFYPTSLFPYQGDIWGVFSDGYFPLAFVSKYNINTGLKFSDDMQININNVPNFTMVKTWFVISAINIDDKIYCNFICADKLSETTFQCVGELNVETGDAEFLYFIPLSITGDDDSYLYTNITKYKK